MIISIRVFNATQLRIMEGYALLITAIAGLVTALVKGVQYLMTLQKHHITKKQLIQTDKMLILSLRLERLVTRIGACKGLIFKMHNGGDLLDVGSELNLTMMDEYLNLEMERYNPPLLRHHFREVQNYRLSPEQKALLAGLPNKKQVFINVEEVESGALRDIWSSQGIKTSILVYLGMNEKGMFFFNVSYQMEGLSHLDTNSRKEIDYAIHEMQKILEVIP